MRLVWAPKLRGSSLINRLINIIDPLREGKKPKLNRSCFGIFNISAKNTNSIEIFLLLLLLLLIPLPPLSLVFLIDTDKYQA